jgi:hypothetical protein
MTAHPSDTHRTAGGSSSMTLPARRPRHDGRSMQVIAVTANIREDRGRRESGHAGFRPRTRAHVYARPLRAQL